MPRTRTAAALALALAAACSPQPSTSQAPSQAPAAPERTAPDAVSAEVLMRHVGVLAHDSMRGRAPGTEESAQTRAYLVRAFQQAGLEPVGGAWEHPFQFTGRRDGQTHRGVNVVGMVRGTEDPGRYVVVTAHYDHVGVRDGQIYNGADDNASGTAALPVMAAAFRDAPPRHSILFVALDAEEMGLQGARAFVANPPVPKEAIALNVNLDMVGRNERGELYAAGAYHSPFLKPALDSVAARAPIRLLLGHDRPDGPPGSDWTMQSDHGAFHAAGIPFVYFGVEDHPDYHRPTDDVEGIMPTFYAGAVATILDAVRTLDADLARIAGETARARADRPAP